MSADGTRSHAPPGRRARHPGRPTGPRPPCEGGPFADGNADARARRQRVLGELAQGMAHDLNNTLALVLGHADLLAELLGDRPGHELAAIISQGIQEAAAAVRRLQRFAHTQPDGPFQRVDPGALLRDTLELARPRWRSRADGSACRIQADIACDPDLPAILGDPGELHELLTNLVLNAVDAMPAGGTLRLAARPLDGGVELAVADTGAGMPREVAARAFDPYFTTKGERGTGLGLTLVQSIARRHGGRVALESRLQQGTAVRVWLPAAPDDETPPARVPERPRRALRILAVEDEEPLARMLDLLLSTAGHAVTLCRGGADALAHLRADPSAFDVVVTDLGMAEASGWDVARASQALRPDLPVVLLTGWGAAISEAERQQAGVSAIVAKPYRRRDLLDALDRVALGA